VFYPKPPPPKEEKKNKKMAKQLEELISHVIAALSCGKNSILETLKFYI